jgi:hypothetical protein
MRIYGKVLRQNVAGFAPHRPLIHWALACLGDASFGPATRVFGSFVLLQFVDSEICSVQLQRSSHLLPSDAN